MLFNSFSFIVFLAVVFLLYYFPPFKGQQVLVLVASSLVFYAWEAPKLLLLLVISIGVNSVASYIVAYSPRRKVIRWFVAALGFNLILISTFKYGALLVRTCGLEEYSIAKAIAVLPLPIGISFYTFESISLLVDLLRARKSEQTPFIPRRFLCHFKETSLFVAFFPHLISGPILKADNFYPQIETKDFKAIPWERIFRRLVIGYFLKVVIADNIKDSTQMLEYPGFLNISSITLLVMVFGYSIQLFADFAGYSQIAIGLALLFGYDLPDNFNFPYIATSLSDFWRRWNISLSSWLRDYLYVPLGGNRKGMLRTYVNLIAVMAIGGMWHGAAWSYAIWGLYHGFGLALERTRLFSPILNDEARPNVCRIVIFSFVTFGWLLFKITNLEHVLLFVKSVTSNWSWRFVGEKQFLVIVIFSMPVVVYHYVSLSSRSKAFCENFKAEIYGALLCLIIVSHGLPGAFIYFQF